jgi:hypothetical protein
MKLKPFLLLGILWCALAIPGCGGKEDGVADAPEQPPQELTPEEEAAEREYTGQKK